MNIPLPSPTGIGLGGGIDALISRVIDVAIGAAFVYFMFQIIFAGFGMLSSEGDKSKIEASRNRMSQSVIGLIIVVSSYTITMLVLKVLGFNFELSIEKLLP